MMDWYSNIPGPQKEEAIKEVIQEMKLDKKYENIIKEVITEMPSLGSMTGWCVGFKPDVKQEVNKRIKIIEDREKEIQKEKEGIEYVLRNKVDELFSCENY